MSCNCKIIFKLVTSAIGICLGVAAFITFLCVFGNKDAGVWGIMSAILAAVCFQTHYLQYKERLDTWHSVETLRGLTFLGFLGLLAGLAALTWYIFMTLYEHIPILPVETSSAIPAVWAFMTAKWGLLLIVYSRQYICELERDNPRLIRL